MKKLVKCAAALPLAALLALAGCGGGGGSSGDNPSTANNPGTGGQTAASNEVPESAGLNSSAFIAFLKTMMKDEDGNEPMKMREAWVAPVNDVGDPEPMG
ncbi:MAG: hypothetical protein LH479_05715 [Polaromonas sp.]|nr:hypothetical protein [Polaromonas sp.]